jgi:hypothetical protein
MNQEGGNLFLVDTNDIIKKLNNMKKYLPLLLLAQITIVSFGQSKYHSIVYLKNESIIQGVITEQVLKKSFQLETAGTNVFVVQMDAIERFKEPTSRLQEGYKGLIELVYAVGIGEFGMDRLKLNIVNGYQINPYFSLGFGTGLGYFFERELAELALMIPVYADFRANFMNNNVFPYLSLGVGYSFYALNPFFERVGYLLISTAGVSFLVSDKLAMNVGIGYEVQRMLIGKSDQYGMPTFHFENSGAISINIGISF